MNSFIEPSSTWSSNLKLNLAMLSYSTGLTIPKLASPWFLRTKAGLLLLIPIQILILFIITVPCLFLELVLGQYSNKAVIKIWDLCPLFRGVGICGFVIFIFYQIYYTFVCTCTLCFIFLALTNEPSWKSCNNTWNTINCFTMRDNYTRRTECYQKFGKEHQCDKMQWQSSVEQFYLYRILNTDDTNGYLGPPQQELLLYALITLALIFFTNYGGPKSTEKFLVMLTVITTTLLILLFITPLANKKGFFILNYLFTNSDKSKLADIKTWTKIVNFSLSIPGLGFGAYITLGTHYSFRTPLHFKVISISLLTSFFTVLYSIALQNFLISLCLQSKMLFDDFFDLEQILAMPDAVFFLQHSSKFWMTMWLSNSYMLGLRSLIVMMSLNAETIYNSFPKARKYHNSCVFIFCVVIYSGGIFLSTRIGYMVIRSFEIVLNDFVLLFLSCFQIMGVIIFYGLKNFKDDVHFMLGIRLSKYWDALYILNPVLLGSVLTYNLYEFYNNSATFQFFWVYILDNFFVWFCSIFVILYGCFHLLKAHLSENVKVLKPTIDWGPKYTVLFKSREMFREYNMAKEYLYRQERFRQEFEESKL